MRATRRHTLPGLHGSQGQVSRVVMAYFGVQWRESNGTAAANLSFPLDFLARQHRWTCAHRHRLETDSAGFENRIAIAYWLDRHVSIVAEFRASLMVAVEAGRTRGSVTSARFFLPDSSAWRRCSAAQHTWRAWVSLLASEVPKRFVSTPIGDRCANASLWPKPMRCSRRAH